MKYYQTVNKIHNNIRNLMSAKIIIILNKTYTKIYKILISQTIFKINNLYSNINNIYQNKYLILRIIITRFIILEGLISIIIRCNVKIIIIKIQVTKYRIHSRHYNIQWTNKKILIKEIVFYKIKIYKIYKNNNNQMITIKNLKTFHK